MFYDNIKPTAEVKIEANTNTNINIFKEVKPEKHFNFGGDDDNDFFKPTPNTQNQVKTNFNAGREADDILISSNDNYNAFNQVKDNYQEQNINVNYPGEHFSQNLNSNYSNFDLDPDEIEAQARVEEQNKIRQEKLRKKMEQELYIKNDRRKTAAAWTEKWIM
jgi:hypothetical protein